MISFLAITDKVDYVESHCLLYQPVRDHAILEYLNLEKNLWSKLFSSASNDKEHLLALVRNEHIPFLDSLGSKYNVFAYEYKLDATKKLEDAVARAWDHFFSVQDILKAQDDNLTRTLTKFEDGKLVNNASNLSEEISREMNQLDFWKNVTNVSSIRPTIRIN